MIIWGTRSKSKDLGQAEIRQCPICEKQRSFKLFLQYSFSHFYYIFGWVTKKQYLLACDVCRRGWELNAEEVESKLDKNPIPFMNRYGWTFLAGFMALSLVVLFVGLSR